MNTLIDTQFSNENFVQNITSYILYYQISLGRNAYETLQNEQETVQKLKQLNLSLDPNEVVTMLIDLINVLKDEDSLHENFSEYLQKKALIHSVADFVNSDTELLNKQNYFDTKQEQILENKFFDSGMKMQYMKEFPNMLKHYEEILDNEYIEQVRGIVKQNLSGH